MRLYKDLTDNESKQRYLDAMNFLASIIKEATDKKPTEKVLKMGASMREIMLYVNKMECQVDDADFTIQKRIRQIKELETKLKLQIK